MSNGAKGRQIVPSPRKQPYLPGQLAVESYARVCHVRFCMMAAMYGTCNTRDDCKAPC